MKKTSTGLLEATATASSTKKMVNPCLPKPQYFLYRIQGPRNTNAVDMLQYLNNYVATVGTNSLSVFPFSHVLSDWGS